MYPEQFDSQLAESVDRFARANRQGGRVHLSSEGDNAQAWSEIAELGWLAAPVPEQDGGLGGSCIHIVIIAQGLGRGLLPLPFTESSILAAHLVSGKPSQSDILKGVCTGEIRLAAALDEPGQPHASEPIQTRLESVAGGMTLTGEKSTVLGATVADHFVCSARGPDGEVAIAIVPATDPGVALQPFQLIDGRIAADVHLNQVPIGPERIVRRGTEARNYIARALNLARLAACAEAIGAIEYALEVTRDHLSTRKQFGVSIGSFQALRHRYADMFSEYEQALAFVLGVAVDIDRGGERLSSVTRNVSAMKARICRASRFVGEQTVQLHGGIGIAEEGAAGNIYKRLLTIETLYGTAAYHTGILADAYLGTQ
jgi:alkylation response protein AidB-like acyl-CoA dehydrogenase